MLEAVFLCRNQTYVPFLALKKPRRDKRGFICLNDNKGDGRNFSRSNKGVMFVCDQFHILMITKDVDF
ncbi:hypothetical protein NRS6186_06200 [Bacillus subtilis]|nr:hypothetical protein DS740_06155 [Bacillus sp. DM2]MBR0021588.1 hypothetical protein [Bacillus subtilis]PRS92328.1 hypothetical protein C6349_12495 [Bacillus subtilis subsp. subtilis]PRS95453.1 hypothetical protein C6350_06920 [Bacillus subtilis subsp. subtilis]PWT18725.1 hypothetical protein DLD52_15660 [Bacillus subtilis]